jgi:hypothetical protein
VRTFIVCALAVCLGGASALVVAAQQARPVAAAGQATVEDTLKAVRADLQAERADIIAKNITLSSADAAKFWPMFAQYQKEQDVVMDEQMRGIKSYVDSYQTLTDGDALALINAHFDRDAKMNMLRQRWFNEFQRVIGTKVAVRVMQIDRRLSLAHQLRFTAEIPLAH